MPASITRHGDEIEFWHINLYEKVFDLRALPL